MANLRISDLPAGNDGRRRVTVTWQHDNVSQEAMAELPADPGTGDGERIRWYLEDYAEFPADPAPAIARQAEQRLAQTTPSTPTAVQARCSGPPSSTT